MKFIAILLTGMSVYYSIANCGAEIDTVSGVIADIKASIYLCSAAICFVILDKEN